MKTTIHRKYPRQLTFGELDRGWYYGTDNKVYCKLVVMDRPTPVNGLILNSFSTSSGELFHERQECAITACEPEHFEVREV